MYQLERIKALLAESSLSIWLDTIESDVEKALSERTHGDEGRWRSAYDRLPDIECASYNMASGVINILGETKLDNIQTIALKEKLEAFIPWRKGPFNVHGIYIDTEWRSDWKWERVKPHISDLKDKVVLDVGCGSGYHGWRMADAGAKLVIGIDPGRLFYFQYKVIQHFLKPFDLPFFMLPLGIQHLTKNLQGFDTVFSMGIFYHRKSPFDHLSELKSCLKPGGELILETLVVDGEEGHTLVPQERYAKMRNVWFIPSIVTLSAWMKRAGYKNIRVADVNVTSTDEQRSTEWMRFESLSDFLDPNDSAKTIEGYPAPKRAVIIAKA
ncbi:MAG: tRNA 5-methoxyuridine(34)/uridine 5-oxyacetic acid(34) synthase CmoB [Gammaproteobacteria bacterium]|jgi:tRNA (mo5U34)-methyltransferase